jgi:hypothetical protein
MPNANECELARVYVRNLGGNVSEESIKDNVRYEIVADAECGQTLLNTGGGFKLSVYLTDLVTDITTPAGNLVGNFKSGAWPNPALSQAFPQPASTGARDDHAMRAFGVLQAGAADPIVDFEESDIFIVTTP